MATEVLRPNTKREKTTVGEAGERKRLGERERTAVGESSQAPRSRQPLSQASEPTYYIGGGNGVAIIEQVLNEMGWKRTKEKNDENFRLKWTESKSAINYNAFREGEQMVNHIPNCNLLTNKMGLLTTLQEYDRVTLSVKKRSSGLDFIPETYRLDNTKDRDAFFATYKEGEVWICKPTGMNQGKGIYLVKTQADLDQLREGESSGPGRPKNKGANRIIQRYLAAPLLLEGRKFDIRCYMLIASTVPYLVLYHQGYCRLSMYSYDTKSDNIIAHLTNQFIQKRDPTYQEVKENTAWSMDKLNEYVNDNVAPNKGLEKDWVHTVLPARIKQIMMYCFNAVKHKFQCKVGYFELYGFDFLIDQDMKVWLIEVNINPCLAINCEALRERVPGVVKEAIHIAVECFEKVKKNRPIMPVQAMKEYELLYCGNNTKTVNHGTSASPQRQPTVKLTPAQAEPIKREKSVSPSRRTRSLSPVKDVNERARSRLPATLATKSIIIGSTNLENFDNLTVPVTMETDSTENTKSSEKPETSATSNGQGIVTSNGNIPVAYSLAVPGTQTSKLKSARSPYSESLMLKMTHVQPGLGLMQRRQTQRSKVADEKANRGS